MFYHYRIPIFIIIASSIISLSIIFNYQKEKDAVAEINLQEKIEIIEEDASVKPVSYKDDLFIGNPEAEIIIIEYGDLQCPYCQRQHPVLYQLLKSEYGISGTVAWVFRHYPHIDETSYRKAELVECVREITNDEIAWKFIGQLLEVVEELQFPEERIKSIAKNLDINERALLSCEASDRHKDTVMQQREEAQQLKAANTPYFVFITKTSGIAFKSGKSYDFDDLVEVIKRILNERHG
ncbi:MAG: thioredoxin domain-containing protein [Candidatus Campbellbacteria bacterium]|nr:thioredoxin domain-containing protein [Candidatus Campbellbacteria bacterium]